MLAPVRGEGDQGAEANPQRVEDLRHRPDPDGAVEEKAPVGLHEEFGARQRVRQRDCAEKKDDQSNVRQGRRHVHDLPAGRNAVVNAEVHQDPRAREGAEHAPLNAAENVDPAALLQHLVLPEVHGRGAGTFARRHQNPLEARGDQGVRTGNASRRAPEVRQVRSVEQPGGGVEERGQTGHALGDHERGRGAGVARVAAQIRPGQLAAGEQGAQGPGDVVQGPRQDHVVVQGHEEGAERCRNADASEPGEAHVVPHAERALAEHLPQAQLEHEEGEA
mmetsp:Transcript_17462/g.52122  ORF Transcript_17462/g.52122 Transcript_17462/m.52122 type:complete len:277 (+) Transcript_17462:1070-1900(+)